MPLLWVEVLVTPENVGAAQPHLKLQDTRALMCPDLARALPEDLDNDNLKHLESERLHSSL